MMKEQPFETIESAHEYLKLLSESIQDALVDIERDCQELSIESGSRTLEAVELAVYLMKRLDWHVSKARQNLCHLRTIRDLVFKEREIEGEMSLPASAR